MARKPPRKPSEPLAKIVFRAGGRGTHMVVEPLPEVKEDLELTIVTKFIAAMEQAEGHTVEPPTRGDEWPDFETRADGRKIGIEVVEVINPDHAQKRARQSQYLKEVLPLVQDLEPVLDGVALTLTDGYQDPAWPPVGSAQGQRLIQHIAGHLRAEVDVLARTPRGPGLFRQWDFEALRAGCLTLRGRPISGSLTKGLDLKFSGTFPIDGAKLNAMLATTIDEKIQKAYAAYGSGDLWLLAYAPFYPVIEEGPVSLARAVLRSKSHPFAAVWAFFPFSGEQAGVVAKVFP